TLRAEADRRVADDVALLDQSLQQVHELNKLIVRQRATGQETAALEEQRARALEKIAGIVDIRVSEQPDGAAHVGTRSGLTLLDASRREIRYAGGGQVDTSSTFDAVTAHRV